MMVPWNRLPWLVEQAEADQLFVSWPVTPRAVADRIPAPLALDLFEDRAWITLVVFRMERLRPRWLPPVPGLSRFAEVNCLTQVRRGAERGVWFFRIDVATRLCAAVGRLFALPYHHAEVSLNADGDWRRARSKGPPARGGDRPELRVRYRPMGLPHEAPPETLAYFIVERLVMFSMTERGALLRGVQARPPRRIHACEVVVERNTLLETAGVPGPAGPLTAWYCPRSLVRIWLPVPAPLASSGSALVGARPAR